MMSESTQDRIPPGPSISGEHVSTVQSPDNADLTISSADQYPPFPASSTAITCNEQTESSSSPAKEAPLPPRRPIQQNRFFGPDWDAQKPPEHGEIAYFPYVWLTKPYKIHQNNRDDRDFEETFRAQAPLGDWAKGRKFPPRPAPKDMKPSSDGSDASGRTTYCVSEPIMTSLTSAVARRVTERRLRMLEQADERKRKEGRQEQGAKEETEEEKRKDECQEQGAKEETEEEERKDECQEQGTKEETEEKKLEECQEQGAKEETEEKRPEESALTVESTSEVVAPVDGDAFRPDTPMISPPPYSRTPVFRRGEFPFPIYGRRTKQPTNMKRILNDISNDYKRDPGELSPKVWRSISVSELLRSVAANQDSKEAVTGGSTVTRHEVSPTTETASKSKVEKNREKKRKQRERRALARLALGFEAMTCSPNENGPAPENENSTGEVVPCRGEILLQDKANDDDSLGSPGCSEDESSPKRNASEESLESGLSSAMVVQDHQPDDMLITETNSLSGETNGVGGVDDGPGDTDSSEDAGPVAEVDRTIQPLETSEPTGNDHKAAMKAAKREKKAKRAAKRARERNQGLLVQQKGREKELQAPLMKEDLAVNGLHPAALEEVVDGSALLALPLASSTLSTSTLARDAQPLHENELGGAAVGAPESPVGVKAEDKSRCGTANADTATSRAKNPVHLADFQTCDASRDGDPRLAAGKGSPAGSSPAGSPQAGTCFSSNFAKWLVLGDAVVPSRPPLCANGRDKTARQCKLPEVYARHAVVGPPTANLARQTTGLGHAPAAWLPYSGFGASRAELFEKKPLNESPVRELAEPIAAQESVSIAVRNLPQSEDSASLSEGWSTPPPPGGSTAKAHTGYSGQLAPLRWLPLTAELPAAKKEIPTISQTYRLVAPQTALRPYCQESSDLLCTSAKSPATGDIEAPRISNVAVWSPPPDRLPECVEVCTAAYLEECERCTVPSIPNGRWLWRHATRPFHGPATASAPTSSGFETQGYRQRHSSIHQAPGWPVVPEEREILCQYGETPISDSENGEGQSPVFDMEDV